MFYIQFLVGPKYILSPLVPLKVIYGRYMCSIAQRRASLHISRTKIQLLMADFIMGHIFFIILHILISRQEFSAHIRISSNGYEFFCDLVDLLSDFLVLLLT